MIGKVKFLLGIFILVMFGCKDVSKAQKDGAGIEKSDQSAKETANAIMDKAIKAHGGKRYENAQYQFVFRDKTYSFSNKNGYTYSVKATDSLGNRVVDTLRNGMFTRNVNNGKVELSDKDVAKYSNALNSVIYFATLPHKLSDASVHKEYLGETVIRGEAYDCIKVTFEEEGGGEDHDDVFMYWINKKSYYIDYLAYSYSTNDGGVRFRNAYNPRTIDGIRFQDYLNWEAPVGTPLERLPALFEKGQLKELSKIQTEDVQNLGTSNPEA